MGVKHLPDSETKAPGALFLTPSGRKFNITSNADRTKFTLWEIVSDGYEKVSTSNDYVTLREKIPMLKK